MSATLLLVAIVIVSFAAGHVVTRFVSRYIVLSGAEYVLVGVLLGPRLGVGLVSEATLTSLAPFVSLLLGLVGFLVGLRARGAMAHVDFAVAGGISAVGVVLATAGVFLSILVPWLPPGELGNAFVVKKSLLIFKGWIFDVHFTSTQLWLALALGAAACVSSPLLVEGFKRQSLASGRVTAFLESAARVSQIVAVLTLGVVLATARALATDNPFSLSVIEWVLAALGGGILCGLLFGLFIGRESEPGRLLLASLGLVTFASGVAAALGISAMFINLIAGLTVAVASPHALQLREQLDRWQHPLFVLLMIFAGALWSPVAGLSWLLPVLYVVVRFVSRRVATHVATSVSLEEPLNVARIGNGLLGQGTLAVAIALDCSLRFLPYTGLLLTTVVVGTLLSELWSQRALRALLADAGELQQASADATLDLEPRTEALETP